MEKRDPVVEAWYESAKAVRSKEGIASLIDEMLASDIAASYEHSPDAVVAAAIAAAELMAHKLGITGFQASFAALTFPIRWFFGEDEVTSICVTRFDDYLYPQHAGHFDQAIDRKVWDEIQRRATQLLEDGTGGPVHPMVKAHWRGIVAGNPPFGLKVEQ